MKLGAQMYSLRNSFRSPEETELMFRRLKEIGYDNAQLSGMSREYDPHFLYRLSKKYHLPLFVPHVNDTDLFQNTEKIINDMKVLHCDTVGLGAMPKEYRGSAEGCRRFLSDVAPVVQKIKDAGLSFSYHNHAFEFDQLPDSEECIFDILLQNCPDWLFMLDTYWVTYAGRDVLEYMDKVGKKRLPNIHYKDMDCTQNRGIIACGKGILNFEAITKKAFSLGVKNVFIEQDNAPQCKDSFGEMQYSYLHIRPLLDKYKK